MNVFLGYVSALCDYSNVEDIRTIDSSVTENDGRLFYDKTIFDDDNLFIRLVEELPIWKLKRGGEVDECYLFVKDLVL